MSSKNRKPKRPSRLPAIVPRFLKSAVTVGAIPALWGCGNNHPRMQPVVAQMVNEPQPVVAAYQPDQPPDRAMDAGADAAPTPVQPPVVAAVVAPPPPVVAAMVPHGPPPVVAAMVPHPQPPPPKKKKTPPPPQPRPPIKGVAAMFAPDQELDNTLPPPSKKTP